MHSPWQILGLDASSASEKDAKIAYARLIKLHRPDTDPEGFQRVREAYEIGLDFLRNRKAQPPVPEPESSYSVQPDAATETRSTAIPEPVNAEPALPDELTQAEAAVRAARLAGNPGAIGKGVGSLFYLCTTLAGGRAGIELWHQSLHRVTDGRSDVVAMGVSIPQLIAEMESGMSVVSHACIGWWEKAHDLDSIRQLGEAILNEPRRVNEVEASIVALRLAMEIAFVDPSLSARLTDFAFPHLDRDARESVIEQIEQQAATGHCFKDFRKDQQAFWHCRFRRPGNPWLWNDPTADAALEYLANTHESTWQGYDQIKQIAPAEWYARLRIAVAEHGGQQPEHTANLEVPSIQEIQAKQSRMKARVVKLATASVALVALVIIVRQSASFIKQWQLANLVKTAESRHVEPLATSSPMPMVGSQNANAAVEARIADIRRQTPSLESWQNLLLNMHRQAFTSTAAQFRADPKMDGLRVSVQSLFDSISKSENDPSIEQRVLEVMILSSSTPDLIKQEALFRQQHTQVLTSFLPCWVLASKTNPATASFVAQAAKYYVDQKGDRLSIDPSERESLMALAKQAGSQPAPAEPK